MLNVIFSLVPVPNELTPKAHLVAYLSSTTIVISITVIIIAV